MDKSPARSEINRAARISKNCLRCGTPLTGRQEKFCSDYCRWQKKNEVRLWVEQTIFAYAQAVLRLKPEKLIEFCINELTIRGYDVKKKEHE